MSSFFLSPEAKKQFSCVAQLIEFLQPFIITLYFQFGFPHYKILNFVIFITFDENESPNAEMLNPLEIFIHIQFSQIYIILMIIHFRDFKCPEMTAAYYTYILMKFVKILYNNKIRKYLRSGQIRQAEENL